MQVHLGYCIAPPLVTLHPSHPFSTSCGLVRSCLAARRRFGLTLALGSSPRRSPPTTALPKAAARPSKTRRRPLPTPTPMPAVTRRLLTDFGEHAATVLAASTLLSSSCASPSLSCLPYAPFLHPFMHVCCQCVFVFGFRSDIRTFPADVASGVAAKPYDMRTEPR